MQIKNEKASRYIIAVAFIVSFFFMVKSMVASTEYAMKDYSIIPHFIYLGAAMLAWISGQILLVNKKEKILRKQFFTVDIIIAVIFGLLIMRGKVQLYDMGREKYLYSYGMIIIGCLFPVLYNAVKNNRGKVSRESIPSWLSEHKWILLLEIVVFILAAIQMNSEARWDSAYFLKYLNGRSLPNIFNIGSLSFCGHISMSFTALNEIFAVIVGNAKWGMNVGTILLLLGSVASFYGIIKEILPEKLDFEYTLLTSCWAMSPFVLGLAGLNYWDQWLIMLFPAVVYFALKKQWVYHLILAFLMCFIKETAIIGYAGYCSGILCFDICRKRDIRCLTKPRYWGMLAVGISWLYVYIVLPNWDGVGGIVFDAEYILEKVKVLYVLNFNWILVLFAIRGMLSVLQKRKDMLEKIIPLLVSDIAFVIFSCLFKTINHARYINTHVVVIYILAVIGIVELKKNIRYGITIILVCILFISNYRTVDFFTKAVFKTYNVGTTEMVSTCGEILSDSMVYNQQWRFFDKALDMALKDAVDEEAIICFPQIQMRSWFFEGIYADAEVDEIRMQNWDTKQQKRVLDENDVSILIPVCNIDSKSDMKKILDSREGYFFYLPFAGYDVADMIKSEMDVMEEKEFSYGGWTITRIKFAER